MTRRRSRPARRLALVGALAAIAVAAGPAPPAGAARCTPAEQVALLLDDSQSMYGLDPARNRLEVAGLLLSKAANRGAPSYAALEFGSQAASVFPPTRVRRANVRVLLGSLAARAGENGSQLRYLGAAGAQLLDTGRDTNLDRAFAAAGVVSPGAEARVLITDGGHNEAAYANGHRRGARTYVAGLGRPGGVDAARLRRIARETRGRYLPQPDSGLTPALDAVDARLSCARSVRALRSTHTRAERRRSLEFQLRRGTRSAELTLLWRDPRDRFELPAVQLLGADGSPRRPARARQRRLRGRMFVTLRLTGPGVARAARLRVLPRAARLASAARAVATASLVQSGAR